MSDLFTGSTRPEGSIRIHDLVIESLSQGKNRIDYTVDRFTHRYLIISCHEPMGSWFHFSGPIAGDIGPNVGPETVKVQLVVGRWMT